MRANHMPQNDNRGPEQVLVPVHALVSFPANTNIDVALAHARAGQVARSDVSGGRRRDSMLAVFMTAPPTCPAQTQAMPYRPPPRSRR